MILKWLAQLLGPTGSITAPFETFAYTGTAGTGTAVTDANVNQVIISCTSAAYVTIGIAATATTSNGIAIGIGQTHILPIKKGMRVSAIQQSAGGNCTVAYGTA